MLGSVSDVDQRWLTSFASRRLKGAAPAGVPLQQGRVREVLVEKMIEELVLKI